MVAVTELKIGLSRGSKPDNALATLAIGWHGSNQGDDKVISCKIVTGTKDQVHQQISTILELLLKDLPED